MTIQPAMAVSNRRLRALAHHFAALPRSVPAALEAEELDDSPVITAENWRTWEDDGVSFRLRL